MHTVKIIIIKNRFDEVYIDGRLNSGGSFTGRDCLKGKW